MKKILNNKGMSLVEIMVSVALVSIVLVFLMNLFIGIRQNYNRSKENAEYEIFVSNVINAVGSDIESYGIYTIEAVPSSNSVIITFNTYRETNLSERIKKELKIYDLRGEYYISYKYASDTSGITSSEEASTLIRKIPGNNAPVIALKSAKQIDSTLTIKYSKIEIPLYNKTGDNFTINIYGQVVG